VQTPPVSLLKKRNSGDQNVDQKRRGEMMIQLACKLDGCWIWPRQWLLWSIGPESWI